VRKFGSSEVAVGLAKDGAVTFNFSGLSNGTYRDAVTGHAITVSSGNLSFVVQPGSAGVYILNGPGLIGALGEGFFQNSSSGGGGGSSAVTFVPQNPAPTQNLTITYSGSLASQSQVLMHYSWDNWTVGGVQDKAMVKSGNVWTTTVMVPANARVNFCAAFHNGNGTWDNNGSQDYKTALGNGQSDTQAPTVSSLSPLNAALNVSSVAALSITFSENIIKGTGNIQIFENNELKYTYPVASSNVLVSGSVLTINHAGFTPGVEVYVLVDQAAVKDLANNPFAGFNSSNQWRFVVSNSTGLLEEENHKVLFFPHPFGDALQIANVPPSSKVRLYNMVGKLVTVDVQENGDGYLLHTKHLPDGLYVLELEYKNKTIFRKKVQKQ
jgi:hypothetical protein